MIPLEADDSPSHLVGPEDDDFHPPTNDRWFHETVWFWFFVPERRLGGWLYSWLRPNVGVSGGGCWIWDDSGISPLEVPYYAGYTNLPLPEASGLGDIRFPNGVSITTHEPLRRYQLEYADRDLISVDLEYDAVMPPWVARATGSEHASRAATGEQPSDVYHFDQVGRVSGELVLGGERVEVDCLAIRDRTWSVRPERWKDGHVGYSNGAREGEAFLVSGTGTQVRSGYLLRDRRRRSLVSGIREIEREPDHGYLKRIFVDAEDTEGRRITAVGEPVSRMAVPIPGVHGVVWTSLLRWSIGGETAWGEDQDAWPLHAWRRFVREGTMEVAT